MDASNRAIFVLWTRQRAMKQINFIVAGILVAILGYWELLLILALFYLFIFYWPKKG